MATGEIGGHVRAVQRAQLQLRTGIDAAFRQASSDVRSLILDLEQADGFLPPRALSRLAPGIDAVIRPMFRPGGTLERIIDDANTLMIERIAAAHQRYMEAHLPDDLVDWLRDEALPRPQHNRPQEDRERLPLDLTPGDQEGLLREVAMLLPEHVAGVAIAGPEAREKARRARAAQQQGVGSMAPYYAHPGAKYGHSRRAMDQVDEQQMLFRANHLDYDPLHNFVYPDGSGYSLSDRVWNAGQQARRNIDRELTAGIQSGAGAEQVARNVEGMLRQGAKRRGAYRVWRPSEPGAGPSSRRGRWVSTPKVSYPAWRLARTEIAASAGRFTMASARANPLVDRMEWRVSQNHPRADECDNLAGTYALNDFPPFPNHPNCWPAGTLVSAPGRVVAAMKAPYHGLMVEVRLESGRKFTCTENHPILSATGWRAAKLLDVGDNVFSAAFEQGMLDAIDPDNQNGPVSIEQVFDALREAGGMTACSVPAAAEHFHGDGRFMDGNIEIVLADGLLLREGISAFAQPASEGVLNGAGPLSGSFVVERALDLLPMRGLASPHAFMGRLDSGAPLVRRHEAPAVLPQLAFSEPASLYASIFQSHGEHHAANAHLLGESQHAFSVPVAGNENMQVGNVDAARSGISGFGEAAPNRGAANAQAFSDVLDSFAGPIAHEQVVSVRKFEFTGHVYDLQVEPHNMYTANTIIAHNCLCMSMPIRTRSPQQVVDELLAAREAGLEVPYTNPANAQNWARWGEGKRPVSGKPKASAQPAYLSVPQQGRPGARPYTRSQLDELTLHEGTRRNKEPGVRPRTGDIPKDQREAKALMEREAKNILKRRRFPIGVRYDDGGRWNAGYNGYTGDCAVRSLSIYTNTPYETAKTLTENARITHNQRRLGTLQQKLTKYRGQVRVAISNEIDKLRVKINHPYSFKKNEGAGTPHEATIEAGRSSNLRLAYDGWPAYARYERTWSNMGKTWRQAYRDHGDGIYSITAPGGSTHSVAVIDGTIHDTWDSRFYHGRQGRLVESRVIAVMQRGN